MWRIFFRLRYARFYISALRSMLPITPPESIKSKGPVFPLADGRVVRPGLGVLHRFSGARGPPFPTHTNQTTKDTNKQEKTKTTKQTKNKRNKENQTQQSFFCFAPQGVQNSGSWSGVGFWSTKIFLDEIDYFGPGRQPP